MTVGILLVRTLLTSMVEIESQRLEIAKQRLDVERQRLEYEKTVGNELLSMLRTFIGGQSKAENHQNNIDANMKPSD